MDTMVRSNTTFRYRNLHLSGNELVGINVMERRRGIE